MKPLVIEVLSTKTGKRQYIRVVSQDGTGANFFFGQCHFRAKNGFQLISSATPQIIPSGLYVQGSSASYNESVLEVSSTEWLLKLEYAVRAFNVACEKYDPLLVNENYNPTIADTAILESLYDLQEEIGR